MRNFCQSKKTSSAFSSLGAALLLVSLESRPLARSKSGSPRFTDFPSLCACSEKSLTNLTGSGLNLLCLQIHSKPECRWIGPEVAILGANQKARPLGTRMASSASTRWTWDDDHHVNVIRNHEAIPV